MVNKHIQQRQPAQGIDLPKAQPGLPPKALRPLCAVGSRTLLIYMLHQPVIYGALLGLHALGLA